MSIYSFLTELAIPAAWQDAIAALLILFVAWLVGMILSWALGKAGHYFAQKAKSELGDQVILSLRSPLFLLCLLVGAYLAADELSLPSRLFRSIEGIIYALGVFLGALVLKRIFDAFIIRIAGQVARRTGSRLYAEFSPLLDKVATFFIFGVALIIVLARLGYSVTSLVAAPTASGVKLAFTLSSAAEVTATLRNLAGRPVRALCRSRPAKTGTNVLLWDARSDTGLPAPAGVYLAEVTARCPSGAQTTGLVRVVLRR